MNGSSSVTPKIVRLWWLLRLTYGLLFVVAGADKFLNMVTNWSKYISPMVLINIPVPMDQLIMAVGILEIFIGLIILSRWTHFGAHLASLWLLVITGNLLTMGFPFDIAVRDVVMAIGAFALALLTKIKEEALSTGR